MDFYVLDGLQIFEIQDY